MKTVAERIRRLEIRFGAATEALRKAVPSAAERIVERLAAGSGSARSRCWRDEWRTGDRSKSSTGACVSQT